MNEIHESRSSPASQASPGAPVSQARGVIESPARAVALAGLLVAVGTLTSHLLWFPAGVAKAFPVQHAINVISAVLLGPGWAVANAFVIGVLRNALGVGTLLAFPGGMIGALLAGLLYQKTRQIGWALAGEIVGTGLLGAVASYPVVLYLMGREAALFGFVVPFSVSTIAGSTIAWALLTALKRILPGQ